MEYLYHGSSGYYKTLIPHQAYDTGFEEGCKNAVYATTNRNMALAFALGAVPDQNGEVERAINQCGRLPVFMSGERRWDGTVIISTLLACIER